MSLGDDAPFERLPGTQLITPIREGGPPLAGKEFLEKWNGKTAGTLFGLMRKTMPSDDPGNLSTRQYSDLVAYMLGVNGFPAGQKELDREMASLDEIKIEMKR